MSDSTVEIYKDKRGEFRWRRTSSNGEITGASSESYKAKRDCEANANRDTSADRWGGRPKPSVRRRTPRTTRA